MSKHIGKYGINGYMASAIATAAASRIKTKGEVGATRHRGRELRLTAPTLRNTETA